MMYLIAGEDLQLVVLPANLLELLVEIVDDFTMR